MYFVYTLFSTPSPLLRHRRMFRSSFMGKHNHNTTTTTTTTTITITINTITISPRQSNSSDFDIPDTGQASIDDPLS